MASDAELGRVAGREGVEVGGIEPPALRPAGAADAQVAREDRAAQVGRRAAARHDPLEPHASGPGSPTPAQPTRASAASIARRV